MKKLSELLNFALPQEFINREVKDIVDDSRKASSGSMFVAVSGNAADGISYISNAIEKGAEFVLINKESISALNNLKFEDTDNKRIFERNGVIFIIVEDTRKTLAELCSKFWTIDFENIVAVTGTNGKSSTVDIVRQIWDSAGKESASVGTLGVVTKYNHEKGSLTSPGAIAMHHIFTKIQTQKINNVAIEASSHGIDQHRLDNIPFSVCAFTNFSQDHLDYHKTFENYWMAKAKLFSNLANENSTFVINADDCYSFKRISEIAERRNIKFISYGKNSNDIKLLSFERVEQYQKVKISFFGDLCEFNLSLAGDFQVYNALCAMGICYATGVPKDTIFKKLGCLTPINGRLELVGEKRGAYIYVDYAHTPDALEKSLKSLRKYVNKRLIVVFGCGGNRDTDKRHLMGKIADDLADIVIVTDDNPRKESAEDIRAMILKGCPNAKEIGDRKEAISFAVNLLSEGDVLLVAGKGHEDYQIVGDEIIHFSDREIILEEICSVVEKK